MNFPSLYFWLLSNACSWGDTVSAPPYPDGRCLPQGLGVSTARFWCARERPRQGLGCPWQGLGGPRQGLGCQDMPRAGVGVTRRDLGCPGMPMEGVGVPRQGLGPPGSACSRWGSQLGGTHIFPAQGGIAALAEDVSHRVQSRQQQPLLSRAAPHVHPAPRVGCPTGSAQPARGPPGLPLPTAILGAPSTHTELNR